VPLAPCGSYLSFDALGGAENATARLADGRTLALTYRGSGLADRNGRARPCSSVLVAAWTVTNWPTRSPLVSPLIANCTGPLGRGPELRRPRRCRERHRAPGRRPHPGADLPRLRLSPAAIWPAMAEASAITPLTGATSASGSMRILSRAAPKTRNRDPGQPSPITVHRNGAIPIPHHRRGRAGATGRGPSGRRWPRPRRSRR
jgi:hypothetical protein